MVGASKSKSHEIGTFYTKYVHSLVVTQASIRLQLAKEEATIHTTVPHMIVIHSNISASQFVSIGLDLEEQQWVPSRHRLQFTQLIRFEDHIFNLSTEILVHVLQTYSTQSSSSGVIHSCDALKLGKVSKYFTCRMWHLYTLDKKAFNPWMMSSDLSNMLFFCHLHWVLIHHPTGIYKRSSGGCK